MILAESWCQFDPLQTVWLGDCYPEQFFKKYQDPVRSALCRISELTKQDLDHIQTTFESLGITVCRPQLIDEVDAYCDDQGRLLRPPIVPRDDNMVLGQDLYCLRNGYHHNVWQSYLDQYQANGTNVITGNFFDKFGYIQPPSIVRLGKDILIDKNTHLHSWHLMETDVIPAWQKDFDVHVFDAGGHADSVFCAVGPGRILTSHWKNDYPEFASWDIYHIPYLRKTTSYHKLGSNSNNWYVDDVTCHHPAFTKHVEQYASDWIGQADETVFSVNTLMLGPNLIMIMGEPSQGIKNWLRKHKVDWITVDMRTKEFWDSGIHCLTVDIKRDGVKRKILPCLD